MAMIQFEVGKCYKSLVIPDQPYICTGRRETPKRIKVCFCSMYFYRRDGEYSRKVEYYAHNESGVECADMYYGRNFNFRADTFDDKDRVYDDPRFYKKPKKRPFKSAGKCAGYLFRGLSFVARKYRDLFKWMFSRGGYSRRKH